MKNISLVLFSLLLSGASLHARNAKPASRPNMIGDAMAGKMFCKTGVILGVMGPATSAGMPCYSPSLVTDCLPPAPIVMKI